MKVFLIRLFVVFAFALQTFVGATAGFTELTKVNEGETAILTLTLVDAKADSSKQECCDHENELLSGASCSVDCKVVVNSLVHKLLKAETDHLTIDAFWLLQRVSVIDLKPPIV